MSSYPKGFGLNHSTFDHCFDCDCDFEFDSFDANNPFLSPFFGNSPLLYPAFGPSFNNNSNNLFPNFDTTMADNFESTNGTNDNNSLSQPTLDYTTAATDANIDTYPQLPNNPLGNWTPFGNDTPIFDNHDISLPSMPSNSSLPSLPPSQTEIATAADIPSGLPQYLDTFTTPSVLPTPMDMHVRVPTHPNPGCLVPPLPTHVSRNLRTPPTFPIDQPLPLSHALSSSTVTSNPTLTGAPSSTGFSTGFSNGAGMGMRVSDASNGGGMGTGVFGEPMIDNNMGTPATPHAPSFWSLVAQHQQQLEQRQAMIDVESRQIQEIQQQYVNRHSAITDIPIKEESESPMIRPPPTTRNSNYGLTYEPLEWFSSSSAVTSGTAVQSGAVQLEAVQLGTVDNSIPMPPMDSSNALSISETVPSRTTNTTSMVNATSTSTGAMPSMRFQAAAAAAAISTAATTATSSAAAAAAPSDTVINDDDSVKEDASHSPGQNSATQYGDFTAMNEAYVQKYCKSGFFKPCNQPLSSDPNRPWVCPHETCTTRFKTRKSLARHYRRHTEYAFVCHICGKKCSRSTNMKEHYRVHTGEKPHRCDMPGCGARFQQKHSLMQHKRVHNGEKPFKCQLCGKEYTAAHNLQLHKSTAHSAQPRKEYKCESCNKVYQSKHGLTAHLKKSGH